jgi:uncharacterized protein (TIGR03437 family)
MATPFRLNVEIPFDAAPGDHTLKVTSPFGTVSTPVRLKAVAPALFKAVVNAEGNQPNSPLNPASRGSVVSFYATGLGAVRAQGDLMVAAEPVSVVLQGMEIQPAFAGPASDLPGTYVINVAIPPSVAPGLDIPVTLRQGGVETNAVPVSIR